MEPQIVKLKAHLGHTREEFFVVCNQGMAEQWRKDPENTPISDVLQVDKIFKGQMRTNDLTPTKDELQSVFGTSENNVIVAKILKEGEIEHHHHASKKNGGGSAQKH